MCHKGLVQNVSHRLESQTISCFSSRKQKMFPSPTWKPNSSQVMLPISWGWIDFCFSIKIYKKAEHFQIIFNFLMLQKNKKHHQLQGQYLHRSCVGYRCLDQTLICPNLWLWLLGVDQSSLASACRPVFEQMTTGFNCCSQVLGTFLVTGSAFIFQLTHSPTRQGCGVKCCNRISLMFLKTRVSFLCGWQRIKYWRQNNIQPCLRQLTEKQEITEQVICCWHRSDSSK